MKRFKLLLIATLIFESVCLHAQKNLEALSFDDLKNKKLVTEFIWGDYQSLADFEPVPDEYKDEAAVILKKERYYSFKGTLQFDYGRYVLKRRYLHREIIKLQSKAGIAYYSKFEIDNYDENKDQIGIRLFKPDGSIITIEQSRLIIEETEDESYVKVSIPNLEVGDIIDFYRYDNSKTKLGYNFNVYSPDYIMFVDEFPIVHQYLEFTFFKNTYMLFTLLNNDKKPTILGFNYDYNKRVIFEDRMADKYGLGERWIYPAYVYPGIRFQLGVGSNPSQGYYFFDTRIVSMSRSDEKLRNNIYRYSDFKKPPKYMKKDVKKALSDINNHFDGKSPSQIEKTTYAYNYFRYHYPDLMVAHLVYYLKFQSIEFDIINYIPRSFGKFNQVLSRDEINFGLRIYLDEKEIYVTNNSINTVFGETPSYFNGVDAIAVRIPPVNSKSKTKPNVENITVPIAPGDKNFSLTKNHITIKDQTLEISSNVILGGNLKHVYQMYYPNSFAKYEDMQYLDIETSSLIKEELKKQYENDLLLNLNDTINDDANEITTKSFFKYTIFRNYEEECENLETIEIIHTGRYEANPYLEFTSDYNLNGYVKEMSENYILNIGKLIGIQVNIPNIERERKNPVFHDFRSETRNEIEIEIPEGYTVEGLDQINFSVDNAYGSFQSLAKIDGNLIKISTEKKYKTIEVPVAGWPEVLDYLDAAFDFTEKDILFKKKG